MSVYYEPKKGIDFGPGFYPPDLGPTRIRLFIGGVEKLVGFFCGEHTFGFVAP